MILIEGSQPLTEFQGNTREAVTRLDAIGRAKVLTVNDEAEAELQDARAYQQVPRKAEQAERLLYFRRGIGAHLAGQLGDVGGELNDLEERHLPPGCGRITRNEMLPRWCVRDV